MHPPRRRLQRLTWLTLLIPLTLQAEVVELRLTQGASVRGELLQTRAERTVIDLGFTLLSVPSEAILEQRSITTTTSTPVSADPSRLYRLAPDQPPLSVRDNVARCAEAVVQVRTASGLGSGFFIHPDGYLVTNHHVIDGEYALSVTLYQQGPQELRKRRFEKVRIVALDPELDLALLKVEEPIEGSFPTLPLGDAGALVQGETVFSIGSPLGFDRTISQGIVSLRNRVVDGKLYIQSTTPINSGNSGGPLLDLRGRVVGVTNMKIGAVGIEGLNFAIPSQRLRLFLDNLDAFAFDPTHPNSGYRYYTTGTHGEKLP